MIGASVLRESLRWLAGGPSKDSPVFGTLIVIALAGAVASPAVRSALHGLRGSAHRARADFDHRYGHIIRPSRHQG